MSMEIKLSVITVTYNAERYLRDTFEAMLCQDYKNYEYIIIDGESKDNTISIIKEYVPKFEGRMKYISERDNGLYDAMNKGIDLATGEYIGLINADDFYCEEALKHVINTIKTSKTKPDVVYSDMIIMDENDNYLRTVIGDSKKLKKGMLVNHPTCFVSKAAYEKYGKFDIKFHICADYDLMLRVLHGGGNFVKCEYVLAKYRMGGLSTNNYNSVLEKYSIQRKYYDIIHCLYIKFRGFYRCNIRPLICSCKRFLKK